MEVFFLELCSLKAIIVYVVVKSYWNENNKMDKDPC